MYWYKSRHIFIFYKIKTYLKTLQISFLVTQNDQKKTYETKHWPWSSTYEKSTLLSSSTLSFHQTIIPAKRKKKNTSLTFMHVYLLARRKIKTGERKVHEKCVTFRGNGVCRAEGREDTSQPNFWMKIDRERKGKGEICGRGRILTPAFAVGEVPR